MRTEAETHEGAEKGVAWAVAMDKGPGGAWTSELTPCTYLWMQLCGETGVESEGQRIGPASSSACFAAEGDRL